MSMNPFFVDGYNRAVYVAGRTNIHPALRLTVRPLTVEEQSKAIQDIRTMTLVEEQRYAADLMAPKIVSWSVGADCTPANLLRMPPALFHRLWNVIAGSDGGDPDPETGLKPKALAPEDAAKN